MDAEEVVLCTYCNKEVAKANFSLHEPHCQRFLCLCPDCDDTIPRDQLEDHQAEQHAQVKCQKCNKKMERRYLPDHETDECSERLQSCEFCDIELPLSGLLKHSLSCGSRTERCSDCGRYVQLKDQLKHAQNCSEVPQTLKNDSSEDDEADEQTTSRCQKCLTFISLDDLEEHKLDCHQADFDEDLVSGKDSRLDPADFSFSMFQTSKRGRNFEEELDKITTCPLCHLALPIKTLEWHEKKCQLNKHLAHIWTQ